MKVGCFCSNHINILLKPKPRALSASHPCKFLEMFVGMNEKKKKFNMSASVIMERVASTLYTTQVLLHPGAACVI